MSLYYQKMVFPVVEIRILQSRILRLRQVALAASSIRRSGIRAFLFYRKSRGISCRIKKRTGPQGLPESLTHEGPGRFAAPSAVTQ